MKNSLRMIGISIIYLFGLGVGSVNAVTSTLTFNSNGIGFNAIFGNNAINSDVFNNFYNYTIPAGVNGAGGLSGLSSYDLTGSDVSFTTLELLDSENTASPSGETSSPSAFINVTELTSTDTTSLQVSGVINKFANNASDAE